MLKPSDVVPKLIPGNIFGRLMKDVVQVNKIGTDVGAVIFKGMVSKATEGNHFPERI